MLLYYILFVAIYNMPKMYANTYVLVQVKNKPLGRKLVIFNFIYT